MEGGRIAQIEVYSPKFALEGHSEVKVGCTRQAVFTALPKWTEESPRHVDYDGRGVRFKFTPPQGMVCDAIIVFTPGTSTESEPANRSRVVTDVLNGREGPSLTAARRFKQGERLTVSGRPVKDSAGGWWLPVGDGLYVRMQPDYVRAIRD